MPDDKKPALPVVGESTEFGPAHWTALDISGTIPIPSPSQAPARISFGIRAHDAPKDGPVRDKFFFKIVQHVGDKEMITRVIDEGSMRAIRYREASCRGDSGSPSWVLQSAFQLAERLEVLRKALQERAQESMCADDGEADPRLPLETPLFPMGVVYVAPSAPVLLRLDYGLTAAEAEEICILPGPCC